MADWTFLLCDHTGVELTELQIAPTLRWELNAAAQITFKLRHDLDAAQQLFTALPNGIPQIKCYRDPPLWPGQNGSSIAMRGWWQPSDEDIDADGGDVQLAFHGPFKELEHRQFAAITSVSARDQGNIAVDILRFANDSGDLDNLTGARDVSFTGLIPGGFNATKTRDRTYEPEKQMGEAIHDLTQIIDPLEFRERPVPDGTHEQGVDGPIVRSRDSLAKLDVGGPFGRNKTSTLKFQHGQGTLDNCVKVARTIGRPVNEVYAVGSDGTTTFRVVERDLPSIARYMRHRKVLTLMDVSVEQTLREHAQGALLPTPPQTITFEPDPACDIQPGRDYWLADTAHLYSNRLRINTTARIKAIEIELDKDGNESAHRVELGEQRARWPVGTVRGIHGRLDAIERRVS